MNCKKIIIQLINRYGLHARAAAKFVSIASRFASNITIHYQNKQANGKSIMDVMMLAAVYQSEIEITAEGDDADTALEALTKLIQDRFGETE